MIETCYPLKNRGDDWDVYYPMRKYASKYDWDVLPHERSWTCVGRITPWKNTRQNMIGTCYAMTHRAINTHERKKCERNRYVIGLTAQAPMINTTMINTHELKNCSWANVFPLNITGTGWPIPNQGDRFPLNWSFTDERIYIPQRRWRRNFMYTSAFIWPDIYIPRRRERPYVMCIFISPVEPACFNTCTSLNEDDDSKRSDAHLRCVTPCAKLKMMGTCYPSHCTMLRKIETWYPMIKYTSKYDWDVSPHERSWTRVGRITPWQIRDKIWFGRVTPWHIVR